MLHLVTSFISDLVRHVRPADLLDVGLVAIFFYAVITLLRRSTISGATRGALILTLITVAVYALARHFDLYLVQTMIEVLFVALILAGVVVFQADLRRAVDRIGSWDFFRGSGPAPPSIIDTLTEASTTLADAKTGALIAIKGTEPWERQIQGGVRLDGDVSRPLLLSLFNPKAPGHDGAVLIEGPRITHFAAHLPLASTMPEVSQHGGTRHAAALGLSEHCDALVIVVSEERGTVSVAQDGHLTTLEDPAALKSRLDAFWHRHFERQQNVSSAGWSQHAQALSYSIVLALLLWVVFSYRPETVYRTFVVPVEFRNMRPTWALQDSIPEEARVTLSGPEQGFRLLNPATLVASIDLERAGQGQNTITLAEDNFTLPNSLEVYDVEPAVVRLHLERLHAVAVPVVVQTEGALPDTLDLVDLVPSPDSVRLLVRDTTRERPRQVVTEPIAPGRFSGASEVETRLVLPPETRLAPNQSPRVTVRTGPPKTAQRTNRPL